MPAAFHHGPALTFVTHLTSARPRRARFPSRQPDPAPLQQNLSEAQARVAKKQQQLQDVINQHIAYQTLLQRNSQQQSASQQPAMMQQPQRQPEEAPEEPPADTAADSLTTAVVRMPFIICHTRSGGKIDVQLSPDRRDAILTLTDAFELHDDNDLLRLRGFHRCDDAAALARMLF